MELSLLFVQLTLFVRCGFCDLLSQEERAAVLERHNEQRRQEDSSNMRLMSWNDVMEQRANDFVEEASRLGPKCAIVHSSKTFRTYDDGDGQGKRYHGENVARSSRGSSTRPFVDAVDAWYSEKRQDGCGLTASSKCAHYRQNVWAESYLLGCARKVCDSVSKNIPRRTLEICHYGPGGNIQGEAFQKGEACSACGGDFSQCCDGLCARECDVYAGAGLPWWAWLLIVLGGLLVLAGLVLLVYFLYKRNKKKRAAKEKEQKEHETFIAQALGLTTTRFLFEPKEQEAADDGGNLENGGAPE